MNLSNIMSRIKLKLGLMNIVTPLVDIDETILWVIKEITVPVFSLYQPYKETMYIDMNDLEMIEKQNERQSYLLPEFKSRKLLYVFDVNYDTSILAGLGYYGGGMPLMQGNLINQLMLGNAGANLMNMAIPKLTFKFIAPRTIEIFNAYASTRLKFDLGFEHDKTLASIPETCRESFMELALLDVKENLYPTLKYYNEMETAIGRINLRLDGWDQAEEQKKELINKLDDTYHLDFQPFYYA